MDARSAFDSYATVRCRYMGYLRVTQAATILGAYDSELWLLQCGSRCSFTRQSAIDDGAEKRVPRPWWEGLGEGETALNFGLTGVLCLIIIS